MPEKEARPPAQNRHGGAPRGERVPPDARRASPGADRRAPKRATTEDLRLSALRSPLVGVDGTETSKTRAQQRAAGTKKTALFDIVNRTIAATRSVPAEREQPRSLQIADAFRDILQRLRRGSDPQAVHLPGNRSQADRHAPRVFLPSPSISFASEGVWKSVGDQQHSGSSCRLGACRE